MTGLIDLTYQHDGRWYVLDYKSNRLPGYAPAQLAEAMAHSEYDLQALIYTLALHRWLRFRLGDGYDYARDRKRVVSGKSVSVRVDLGGRRIIKKKKRKAPEVKQT